MSISAEDFFKSFEGTGSWGKQIKWIETWVASGELQRLWELVQLMESPRAAALSSSDRASIFDHIEKVLALTPDLACATMFFRLAALPQRLTIQPWRGYPSTYQQAHLATLLASGQNAETLAALFSHETDGPDQKDILACLSQEMVVRHLPIDGMEVLSFYDAHVVRTSHPLAWLPLSLVSGEQELAKYLPLRQFRSSSGALPFGPSATEERHTWEQPEGSTNVAAVEVLYSGTASTGAVTNWVQESNGKVESRVFLLSRAVEPPEISVTNFAGLGLECLMGVRQEDIHLRRVALVDVLNLLFSAAASGGAYNNGHFAAFGRLEMWRSVAGLVGSPEGASFLEVAALAEQCTWFSFDAVSDWFYQVAWDLGVSALRPDGRTLAVLAATDTD